MRLMLASRMAPIVEGGRERAANATRVEVSGSGYVHDVYEGAFDGSYEEAVDRLLSYKVFPPHRMVARVRTADGRVAVGATIVQRILLGPLAIETAVRVIEVERTADRAAFAYATTVGHPEKGVASFEVSRRPGGLRFIAQAWSKAGNPMAVIGRPVSRYLQRTFTKEAVAFFCGG